MRCWVSSPLFTARCYGIDASASLPGRPLVLSCGTVDRRHCFSARQSDDGGKGCRERPRNDSNVDAAALALLAPSVAERLEIPKRWWQFADQAQAHPWRPIRILTTDQSLLDSRLSSTMTPPTGMRQSSSDIRTLIFV